MLLAKRVFNEYDQERFADASGDRNPMHMDFVQARRMPAGAPVVHGVHLLLWALDVFSASQKNLPSLRTVRAHFSKFVCLDQPVELVIQQQDVNVARLNIVVQGSVRTKVKCTFGEYVGDCPKEAMTSSGIANDLSTPIECDPDSFERFSGNFLFNSKIPKTATLFPEAARW